MCGGTDTEQLLLQTARMIVNAAGAELEDAEIFVEVSSGVEEWLSNCYGLQPTRYVSKDGNRIFVLDMKEARRMPKESPAHRSCRGLLKMSSR